MTQFVQINDALKANRHRAVKALLAQVNKDIVAAGHQTYTPRELEQLADLAAHAAGEAMVTIYEHCDRAAPTLPPGMAHAMLSLVLKVVHYETGGMMNMVGEAMGLPPEKKPGFFRRVFGG